MKVFLSIQKNPEKTQKNPASEKPGVYKPMELTRRIGVSNWCIKPLEAGR